MKDFKMSKYFSFYEMTQTEHRSLLDQNRKEASESALLLGSGYALCNSLLDPVREHFAQPMIIHSGFRCPALNTAIGGAKTSQHMAFGAADFHLVGVPLETIFNWIWKESGLAWSQLILEGGTSHSPATWLHLALSAPFWHGDTQQVMTWSTSTGYRRLD